MYYNLLRSWQKPYTVEMYRNVNLSCLLLRSQLAWSIAMLSTLRTPQGQKSLALASICIGLDVVDIFVIFLTEVNPQR